MAERFPWPRLMALGLGTLSWPPQQFWRSTLREISAALGTGQLPLQRDTLNDLMQRFPD